MMMRLGELLIGQRSPDVFAEIRAANPRRQIALGAQAARAGV